MGDQITTNIYKHNGELLWKIEDIEYLFLEYMNEWYKRNSDDISSYDDFMAYKYIHKFLIDKTVTYF